MTTWRIFAVHVRECRRLYSRDSKPLPCCLSSTSQQLLIAVNRGAAGTGMETGRKLWSQHTLCLTQELLLGNYSQDQLFSSLHNIFLWFSSAAGAVSRWGCFPFSPPDSVLLAQMILTVYLSDGEQAVTEVPITPETTCRDVVEFCKEPGESGCHLAEVWRGNGKSWAGRQLRGSERWRAATVHCTVTADPPPPPSQRIASITDVLTCQHFLLRGHSLVQNNIPDQAGLC